MQPSTDHPDAEESNGNGTPSERVLNALANLNDIAARVRSMGPDDVTNIEATLKLVCDSAIQVVPGSSAVIYAYEEENDAFVLGSRVSAGEWIETDLPDTPRESGLGRRAIALRRRVLSYKEDDVLIHPVKAAAGANSVACYPLIVTNEIVGVLYLYLHADEDRQFKQLELLMLDNFVNQAAMALYHARQISIAQRALARKEDELNRLRRADLLISSRVGLEETLISILEMAMEVTDAHYGIFRLHDPDSNQLVVEAYSGEGLSRPGTAPMPLDESSVMGWVATRREPLLIEDLNEEPWSRIYFPFDYDLVMRSELAVPLIGAGDRLVGVINIESPNVGAFDEQDKHLLQSLATQAVIAIQEARLIDALQEVSERVLNDSYRDVFSRLVVLARDLLNVPTCLIWLMEGNDLQLMASNDPTVVADTIPLHTSLTGQAILENTVITSDDVQHDPRFRSADEAKKHQWGRALIVPLVSGLDDGDEPVGAFSVYSDQNTSALGASDWDTKVLTILAHYAALAVQNAVRQEELRDAQARQTVAETFAALGDISANLLHQLNNKIGTIPVRVQGIQDKSRAAIEQDEYLASNLAEIETSARAAMTAVRENLSLLRPIHLVPVNLARCVDDALHMIEVPGGVVIEQIGLENLPPVMAGQQSLAMVFANLIENASNAMQGTGTITISGIEDGGLVTVSVVDSGPGISPELQDRIFEFNFSAQAKSHDNKLGFGLWWVRTLMTRLGGAVAVESDGQNGAAFLLTLPGLESNR